MEVVSEDSKDHKREYETKLLDYAEAKIAEYWIADPQRRTVIVHQFHGDCYEVHGQYSAGEQATSLFLPGFAIDIAALFALMDEIPE